MATGRQLRDRLERISAVERSGLLYETPEKGMAGVRALRSEAIGDFALFFSRLTNPARHESLEPATVNIARTGEEYVNGVVIGGVPGTRRGTIISRVRLLGGAGVLSYADAARLNASTQAEVAGVHVENIFRSVPAWDKEEGLFVDKGLGVEEYAVEPSAVGRTLAVNNRALRAAIFDAITMQAELVELRIDASNDALNSNLAARLRVAPD